jgi:hypothetical protein
MEIEINSRIRCKGIDISIGKEKHQVALISQFNDMFIKLPTYPSKRLDKIKREFKGKLSSSTHFFFEYMTESDINRIADIINYK